MDTDVGLTLQLEQHPSGAWLARVTTRSGRVLAELLAHQELVQLTLDAVRAAHRWLHGGGRRLRRAARGDDGGAVSGGFLDSVRRITRKLARAKIIRRVLTGARRVLRSPAMAKAVGLASFIPVIGQGIAVSYTAARAADSLLQRARRGDQTALQSIDQVRQQAASGVPSAQEALRALDAASAAHRAQQAAIPQQRAAAAGCCG